MLDRPILGQRPLTAREVARLLATAHLRADANPARMNAALRDALAALDERVAHDAPTAGPVRAWLDWATLTATNADANARAVPADTGIGAVDAILAPLAVPGAQGRDVSRGTTVALEATARLQLGAHVTFEIQPRIRTASQTSLPGDGDVSLRAAALRVSLGNFVTTIGRTSLAWGQGREAGLFLSANAPPLDMVWIGTDRPTTPPSLLRYLGPTTTSLFVADLGARQFFPHTLLIGYKISMAPVADLEAGISVLNFMGGSGAPDGTIARRVADIFFFPVIPLSGQQFSNKMAGLELRYRLSRWGGTQLYWELNVDDVGIHRLASMLWNDDSAQLFGLSLPLLGDDGRWSFAAEFHHTGTRFGRHQQFQSGAAVDRRLIGEPLGPNADGGYVWLDWTPRRGTTLGLALAGEAYRGDQHVITSYDPLTVSQFASRPSERRWRAVTSFVHRPSLVGVAWHARAGIETITDFAFTNGLARIGGLVEAGLTYGFR